MDVTLIRGQELGRDTIQAWRELQDSNPALQSPFFAPAFTACAAAVLSNIEVAILQEQRETVAIFPFERHQRTVGIPVGRNMSDYQGLIARPQFSCNAYQLLRKCGLSRWNFDHLAENQGSFARHATTHDTSPQMDLSKGFERYAADRAASSDVIPKARAATYRLEKDIGSIRFVAHTQSPEVFAQALAWKSHQYADTGVPDLFAVGWTRELLENILKSQTPQQLGMLSALYAGDRLAAVHLGMRSPSTLHYWFPAYDKTLAKYSPGTILLLKMAEYAPSLGVSTIDLGKGASPYKTRLMTGAATVATGSVVLPLLALRTAAKRNLIATFQALRSRSFYRGTEC